MKIAIEAQRIFRKNKHGMDFVALEAIRELQNIDKINEYFIFVSPGEDKCLKETPNFKIIELSSKGGYPIWEQVALPKAIKKIKPDLLHCTSNTAPYFINVPLVLTLHDIIFLEKRNSSNHSLYQEFGRIYRRLVVPRILKKCHKIITVSNFECARIKEALGLNESVITSVYNGYNEHFKPLENSYDVTKKYIDAKDFLFFLGNTDPKKNVPRTLKAYSIYLEKSTAKSPLLIADLKEDVLDIILKEQNIFWIKPYLRCPGYIANSDLVYIYNGAKAFLYTSLRESFGIPSLEAMACGTPVVTSNTSAIPEIVGDGAILTNPTDENDIADAILRLEEDEIFYNAQVQYGLERVKLFSWKNTANELMLIYKLFK